MKRTLRENAGACADRTVPQFSSHPDFDTGLVNATSDRSQGRERQAERGGDFDDQPSF
jgi:hypothetical protein